MLVGCVALACLATAAAMWIFTERPEQNQFLSAVTRVGIVIGALWLALPKEGENVAWGKAAMLMIPALVLVALHGRRLLYLLPVAIGVALLLAILRPRARRRRSR